MSKVETLYLSPTGEKLNPHVNNDVDDVDLLNDTQSNLKQGSLSQVVCLALPAFTILFAVTIYAPLVDRLKADYHATTVTYNLNITFALAGLALAPIILNPLLDVLGGKRAFLCSWVLFIVFSIGSAFVNNLGGLVVLRFFGFLFGGPVLSLFQAALISLSKRRSQHLVFSLASAACLLGLSLGPVIGGLIEGHARGMSQNWSRYLIPIMSLVAILPYVIFGSSLLALTGHPINNATSGGLFQRIKAHFMTNLKPFIHLNTKEPIVIGITLYLSQIYFFFFVTLGAFPYAFGQIRGYTPSEVALTFLSLVVGVILSTLVPLVTIRQRSFSSDTYGKNKMEPEAALRDMLYCSVLMIVGLFLFAWTGSMPGVHWAAPMVGMIIFAFGANIAFTQLNVYLANVYNHDEQTALACPLVSQSLTASIAPLLTLFMIHRVSFQGSLSILAGVLLGLTAIPALIWWKGDKLRNRSMYAVKV